MARPGLVVRGALVTFGAIFAPLAVWFAWRHFWIDAVILAVIAIAFLRTGLSRNDSSWIAAIDDLDGDRKR